MGIRARYSQQLGLRCTSGRNGAGKRLPAYNHGYANAGYGWIRSN